MSVTEQQNMEKQPSIVSKDGESVNKGETSENVENIGVETGDYDIDNIRTKEYIANTETGKTRAPKGRSARQNHQQSPSRTESNQTKLNSKNLGKK